MNQEIASYLPWWDEPPRNIHVSENAIYPENRWLVGGFKHGFYFP
jgi:hypothetical protein